MPKENPVIAFLNKMADLILLNLIFLLCCIPVVTIGPAITALYAVSLRSVRYGETVFCGGNDRLTFCVPAFY